MTITLYEILGLFPDATPEEIKAAYREESKIHHPDKGGDPEEFQTIQNAYEILSDPDKRAYYDKHGEEPDAVDNSKVQIIGIAVKLFKEAVKNNPSNILESVRSVHNNSIRDIGNDLKSNQKELKRKQKILTRITGKPENDFLGIVLSGEIEQIEATIIQIEDAKEHFNQALNLLLDYSFTEEEEQEIDIMSAFREAKTRQFKWTI